jgi:hypothetical protein
MCVRSCSRRAGPAASSLGAARRFAVVLLAIPLILAAFSPTPAAARKAYRAESYTTALRVNPDGSIAVHEEIRVRFDGGPFTFFYRGIPYARTDGIDALRSPDSTVTRRRKERVDITWRFAPCRDTVRTFVLDYLARGAVYDKDGHPRIRWTAFPTERAYRIDAASATIVLPAGTPEPTAFRTEPGNAGIRSASSWLESPGLVLPPMQLAPNRTVVLQVDLPAGALACGVPAWQQERMRWKERSPGVFAAAVAILVLGLFWVVRARAGLLAKLAPGTAGSGTASPTAIVSEPPEDCSPALAGALVAGQSLLPHAGAVLFDLVRRGVLRMDPGPSRGRWASPRPVLSSGDALAELMPWERCVRDSVLERRRPDGSAEWRAAVSALYRRHRDFTRAVQDGMVQRGLFDPAGLEGRRAMKRRILFLLVPDALVSVAGVLLLPTLGPFALLPLGALAIVMVAAALATTTFPLRTRRGKELAASWKMFARALKQADRGTLQLDSARFAAWLPHAVALGVAPAWVKNAKRRGLEPPEWFRSGSGDVAHDMRTLAAVIVIVSSSGGHGGAGAGGAAGGGSSGAG